MISKPNLDSVDELGVGVVTLGYGLGCWLALTFFPRDGHLKMWVLLLSLLAVAICAVVILGVRRGMLAAKRHLTRTRSRHVEVASLGRKKYANALWGMFMAQQLVLLFQTQALPPSDFSFATAFLGLVAAGFYTYEFARSAPWKRYVVLILVFGTVLAALPTVFLESLFHPLWMSKNFPPSPLDTPAKIFTLFGVTILLSGGCSLWRVLHAAAPLPQAAK